MTCICVEPGEMTATASVLRGSAQELAGVGGELQSQCCGCSIPAEIEGQVLALAAAIEAALAAVADDLNTQAGDLDTRGTAAANDSLVTAATAASSISGPGFAWPDTTASTVGFVGGGNPLVMTSDAGPGMTPVGTNPTSGFIGGSSPLVMTSDAGPSMTPVGTNPTSGFIGGSSPLVMTSDAGPGMTPVDTTATSGVIGGVNGNPGVSLPAGLRVGDPGAAVNTLPSLTQELVRKENAARAAKRAAG